MLGFLTGGKVDHPMADAKQAREIINELPSDALKALDEITQLLESLRETSAYKVERLYENIDLLDSAAKSHQRKIAQDYFATARQQKFQENRLWTRSYMFSKELSDAYLECVDRFESGQTGGLVFRKKLPVIVARALRALTLQLKWILVRYGPVAPQVWADVGRVYQFGEASGIADGKVEIYPGAHGSGSARGEFLKALMLGVSATDGLSPVRQELAERVIAHFSPGFRLRLQPGPGCGYCFDIVAGKPPFRVMGDKPMPPTARYFGAGEALTELRKVESIIRETGAIPSSVDLGGRYDNDTVLPVLRHLAIYWSDDVPARTAARRQTATRMTVLHGMTEIMRMLDPDNSDELDFSSPAAAGSVAESWIVENASDGGYGAIIPAARGDWVRVGALIGLKTETSQRWGAGIIRRVARDQHQQRRVGVQVLSNVAIPVRLRKSGNSVASGPTDSGLLLSATPNSRGEVGVVLREGLYNSRDSLDMVVNNKHYLLMPSRLAEGGEDFDWAMFKVMARS
ncbi:MAG: hypothetical protein OEW79_03795 [Betaproteobacteria bacterium]|nr:hypothetical protein [Betaproteobacteria bacterium]